MGTKNMEQLRGEIWDLVYQSGPQTINQIADRLRLNHVMVAIVVDHEWFLTRDETVTIATNEETSDGKGSTDL